MIEFRSLRQEELEDWFHHCMYVFNNGVFSESYLQYFKNHWYNDPWRDLDSILVAVDDGHIASTVRVFHRSIYFMGQHIRMGGIGEVSTKPEYQGRGLAARLLMDAVRLMEKKGIKVSMLDTGFFDFYRKFGWESVAIEWKISVVKGEKHSGRKVQPMDFSADIPQVERIYREYSSKFTGPVARNEGFYWMNWVRTEIPDTIVIEDKSGKISAYLSTKVKDGRLAIVEFGSLAGCEAEFGILASYACCSLGMESCEVIYPRAVESGLTVKEVETDRHIMFRLITPFTAENRRVETSEQLISLLNGEGHFNETYPFLFWHTDDF